VETSGGRLSTSSDRDALFYYYSFKPCIIIAVLFVKCVADDSTWLMRCALPIQDDHSLPIFEGELSN
jgi:hypothetical protein